VWTHPEDISLPIPTRMTEESAVEPVSAVSAVPVVEAELEKPVVEQAAEIPKSVEEQKPEPVVKMPETLKPLPTAKPAPIVKQVEPAKVAEVAKPVVPAKPLVDQPQSEDTKQTETSVKAASEAPVAAPKPEVPLAQLMKRPIHIVFNEDAWMEIIDVNGEILLSRVTKAGEEKWIGGGHRAPYDITIGKPGAIRMYYHGKEVDLSQFNPASVAKLILE
jgi:cytoskeletal protein RodZ